MTGSFRQEVVSLSIAQGGQGADRVRAPSPRGWSRAPAGGALAVGLFTFLSLLAAPFPAFAADPSEAQLPGLHFGSADLGLVVRRMASRSPTLSATLVLYSGRAGGGAGTGLTIRRASAGKDRSGRKARASFHARFEVNYEGNFESIHSEGELFPATARFLTSADLCFGEIIIDDSIRPGSLAEELLLLHEFGHADSAIRDARRYLELGADDHETDAACEPLAPTDRPLEQEAETYLRRSIAEQGREYEISSTWFPSASP